MVLSQRITRTTAEHFGLDTVATGGPASTNKVVASQNVVIGKVDVIWSLI